MPPGTWWADLLRCLRGRFQCRLLGRLSSNPDSRYHFPWVEKESKKNTWDAEIIRIMMWIDGMSKWHRMTGMEMWTLIIADHRRDWGTVGSKEGWEPASFSSSAIHSWLGMWAEKQENKNHDYKGVAFFWLRKIQKRVKTMHTLFIDVYYGCVCACVQDVCLHSSSTFVHRFGGISSDTGLGFEANFKVCRCFLTCTTRSHVCHSESSAGEREREREKMPWAHLNTTKHIESLHFHHPVQRQDYTILIYPHYWDLLAISMPKIRRRL